MHQQLWGHKAEEKLYLWVREENRLYTTALGYVNIHFMMSHFLENIQFNMAII
jgi:hypothetical protein